jgi:hypothetical protein
MVVVPAFGRWRWKVGELETTTEIGGFYVSSSAPL